MVKYENHCVDCEQYCIGKSCRNINVPTYYCDNCIDKYADYKTEENDYCKDCAKEYLQIIFDDLTMFEKAKILNVSLQEI